MHNISLEQLSVFKLNLLLRHLQLGKKHLTKYLSEKQLHDLLKAIAGKPKKDPTTQPGPITQTGNIASATHFFLSTFLGSYIGLVTFIDIGFISLRFLMVTISIAAAIGCYLGYINFRETRRSAKVFLDEKELVTAQQHVLTIILEKMDKRIAKISTYLNEILFDMHANDVLLSKHPSYLFPKEAKLWLKQLQAHINYNVQHFFSESDLCKQCQTELQRLMQKLYYVLVDGRWVDREQQDQLLKKNTNSVPAQLAILTDPQVALPKAPLRKPSWWRGHLGQISVGLLPTLLGTFGAFSLYFDAVPQAIEKVGVTNIKHYFLNPTAKAIEIAFGLFLAIYFAYVHVANYRLDALRQGELQVIQKKITNLETMIAESYTKLSILRKIKTLLARMLFILRIVHAQSLAISSVKR